jgi:hypothetical protein
MAAASVLACGISTVAIFTGSAQAATGFVVYIDGGSVTYPCTPAATYYVGFNEGWDARNNCSVRVWMHQNANNTGESECWGPGVYKGISAPMRNVQVTTNKSAC